MNCVSDEPVNYLTKVKLQTLGALIILALLSLSYLASKKNRALVIDIGLIFIFVIYPSMQTLLFTWWINCRQ